MNADERKQRRIKSKLCKQKSVVQLTSFNQALMIDTQNEII